ncbi:MAG: bifunctional (p)ppGpp synthetase/guanosine-3',5'-bis(diphosphate) 3'-pyrophosphohydrolase [Bacteroidales bacterium]|nr:bifunctional (p)ppGpp synthetase/guanosine-3',5'-bis(diphosphate) 3'-pyrophosphohydrolase [Bacteroidales bacterium]
MSETSSFSPAENEAIDAAFQALLQEYLDSNHRKKVEIIQKAFNFANRAHKGIRRRSGEPYIMHPIAVARICCAEIGLGSTSICSALLHDVVEDTEYTVDDINKNFGPKIASIVEGLTKISGGIFGVQASAQTENFRRLLLTMSEDIRVVLIKMADRLHNMRTLGVMLPSKQYKIAGETMYLYAPLANRLGLNRIKTELENLSFAYEHPDKYKEIATLLESNADQMRQRFDEFAAPIKVKLNQLGLDYVIKARIKSIYSIWNKMQTKGLKFSEIYDLMAVRIIFNLPEQDSEAIRLQEEKKKCWDVYSAVTELYRHHPDRIRDWVSTPKANGYQALHVTTMFKGEWIEVQIRSQRMDEIAEKGLAAHWKYKTGEFEEESELNKWIVTIKEILDNPDPNAIDFLDTIKMNLYSSEIFVFTPKGDIKIMAAGSTALDFAFELHSELGFHCIGAKVNHKLVPMSHVLTSGDQVEILTSKTQQPKPEWLNFVTTGKAKSKLQSRFRRDNKDLIKLGEDALLEYLHKHRINPDNEVFETLIGKFDAKSREDLLVKIATGEVSLNDAESVIKTEKGGSRLVRYWKEAFGSGKSSNKQDNQPINTIDLKKTYRLTEETLQHQCRLADCCQPIPGDDVVGFLEDNGHISVHKRQCPTAMNLKSTYGSRIVSLEWATRRELSFPAIIELRGIDQVGLVSQVARIVSDEMAVNMTRVVFDTKDGIFKGSIELYVHDVEDLFNLNKKLQGIKSIQSIVRQEKRQSNA